MPVNLVRARHQRVARKVVGLAGAPPPKAQPRLLAYHNGPIIQAAEVTTIYWGSAWVSDALRTQLDEFFDFVLTSSLIDQLSEYNAGGMTIGHGRHAQSLLNTADPPATVDDLMIQQFLQSKIADGTLVPNGPNSIYFVFLPSGVSVNLQGATSCNDFCGYHNVTPDGIVYVVDPYDDCVGCQFVPGDTLASSTIVTSHELCEAITDPQLNAWFEDATGEEIGDICETAAPKVIRMFGALDANAGQAWTITGSGTTDATGNINVMLTLAPGTTPGPPPPPTAGQSWTVQAEWSNQVQACV